MAPSGPEAVIHNAPDPALFHPPTIPRVPGPKVRLIAMSWSANPMKGFEVYRHLDAGLDFSRFEMTFIGNSPESFRNIRHLPPAASREVAEELRHHDIFISASHLEACSNAIGEALNCGLVALVRDNSSQPELVGDRRFVFAGREDVLAAVDRVAADLDALRATRMVERMEDVGDRYLAFADRVWAACGEGVRAKRLSGMGVWSLAAGIRAGRLRARIRGLASRLRAAGRGPR
jgi:glycosyltransferase involved in cell wall biosynthesis